MPNKHVVNIYLMQSPKQNLPLSKEKGTWKRKIGVQNKFLNGQKFDVPLFILPIVHIQGDFESCADILITSYWLHVELGKNI
jgi:hypothetical protein